MNDTGSRFRFLRERWHLSPDALATRSGFDVAAIRQAELGDVEPDRLTVWKLAEALCVRPEWLQDGSGDMIGLWHMSIEEQHRQQGGPEQAGLPGYVVIPGGVWERDGFGEWRIERKDGTR